MRRVLIALAALLMLASCTEKKASIPLYGWEGIGKNPNLEEVRAKFQNYKAHGFTGVCIQADLADIPAISAIAHEEGLEYHAWKPCMLQGGKPHEWYAVNRLGQSADEFPAYVQYYQALDPANPEVQDFIVSMITDIAACPDVDYVQLDYIRYADAILARGLWDKYGLDFSNGPYPPADYCYCDRCVGEFKELTGIDILQAEDPQAVPEWTAFRCGRPCPNGRRSAAGRSPRWCRRCVTRSTRWARRSAPTCSPAPTPWRCRWCASSGTSGPSTWCSR